MKIITIVAAAILLSTMPVAASAGTKMEFCAQYEKAAGDIMTGRQQGMRMSKLVAIVNNEPNLVKIIRNAYEWPIQSDEEGKRYVIDEFANAIYSGCIK